MQASEVEETRDGDLSPHFRLDGKAAIVTGGSDGIGRRIAEGFSAAGADLCLMARDGDRLKKASDEIASAGGRVTCHRGTVAQPDDVEATVRHCLDTFGRLDIVVNNAGMTAAMSTVAPDWSEVANLWAINYFGPWRMIEVANRLALADHGGSVINVSSNAALRSRPAMAAYGMAKAALCDLTERLAIELAPGVRVNCIAPGLVPTEMTRALFAKSGNPLEEGSIGPWPLQRGGTVEDIATAALFLASDASSWITGQTLLVDGGASL